MNKVPVSRMAVIRAELAHRSHEDPIFEGETPDVYGLEQLWKGPILGEVGLKRGEIMIGRSTAYGRSTFGCIPQDRQHRSLVLGEEKTGQRLDGLRWQKPFASQGRSNGRGKTRKLKRGGGKIKISGSSITRESLPWRNRDERFRTTITQCIAS